MGSRSTAFTTFARSCLYAALCVIAAIAFASAAKADERSISYCQSTAYGDPLPCVYFSEGTGSSGIDAGDGETWSQASYLVDVVDDASSTLRVSGHLGTFKAQQPGLKIESFTLDIENYEPTCMAWDEYYGRKIRAQTEVATVSFVANGQKWSTKMACTFSREYQGDGYDFKPGVRELSCNGSSLPFEYKTPERYFFELRLLVPSKNMTTENPCKGPFKIEDPGTFPG